MTIEHHQPAVKPVTDEELLTPATEGEEGKEDTTHAEETHGNETGSDQEAETEEGEETDVDEDEDDEDSDSDEDDEEEDEDNV